MNEFLEKRSWLKKSACWRLGIRSNGAIDMETSLWIMLAITAIKDEPFRLSSLTISVSVIRALYLLSVADEPQPRRIWREPQGVSGDKRGALVGLLMIPILCKSIGRHRQDDAMWESYATVLSVSSPFWGGWQTALCVQSLLFALDSTLRRWQVICVSVLFVAKFRIVEKNPSLQRTFTEGEWSASTALLAIALTENFVHTTSPSAYSVSATGLIGSVLSCLTISQIPTIHIFLRLVILVFLPLLVVELHFVVQGFSSYSFPASLDWLYEFLKTTETIQGNYPLLELLPVGPRWIWLAYWSVVLAVAIPFAPSTTNISATVMRKWFHLIAVLLFAPVTIQAPQLMSLSYAIALALLNMLEAIRFSVPIVQEFHSRYLDSSKDNQDGIVVSHIALIAGCAIPLWIANASLVHTTPWKIILELWGVLCLGIGDAMGAVIGSTCGKSKWGKLNRTVEGSFAMWISMIASCGLLCWTLPNEASVAWIPTCTLVTLLEASTMQIDNLFLPLAGATLILLTRN